MPQLYVPPKWNTSQLRARSLSLRQPKLLFHQLNSKILSPYFFYLYQVIGIKYQDNQYFSLILISCVLLLVSKLFLIIKTRRRTIDFTQITFLLIDFTYVVNVEQ